MGNAGPCKRPGIYVSVPEATILQEWGAQARCRVIEKHRISATVSLLNLLFDHQTRFRTLNSRRLTELKDASGPKARYAAGCLRTALGGDEVNG